MAISDLQFVLQRAARLSPRDKVEVIKFLASSLIDDRPEQPDLGQPIYGEFPNPPSNPSEDEYLNSFKLLETDRELD